MKFILIWAMFYLYTLQIIDSRKYRLHPNDELYPYLIDKSVPSHLKYFSTENVIFEQIDDDLVKLDGYGVCTKSMDPSLPLQFSMRTQYLEKSIWIEGPIRLDIPNVCAEFLNPSRFSYNVTKLWTHCPPKEGDKWLLEPQTINVQIDLPLSFPIGQWRGYHLFTQGLMGGVTKFGAMTQVELIEIV